MSDSLREGNVLAGNAAPAELPDAGGAYALLVRLARPLRLPVSRLGAPRLPAGHYLYAGSAYGPGGLRGRLGRHLRHDTADHWHIDHLRRGGRIELVLALPGARECAIVAAARQWPGVDVPVAGFGSSDCGACAAHLVHLPGAADAAGRLAAMAAQAGGIMWRPPPQ